MNKRKGISLIVLVITILVMIILAGVVVVSLQKNNPIEKAKEATFKQSLAQIGEELEMFCVNEKAQNSNYNKETLYASKSGLAFNTKTEVSGKNIYDIIPSLKDSKYKNQVEVIQGNLFYRTPDKKEIPWLKELGIHYTGIVTGTVIIEGDTLVGVSPDYVNTGTLVIPSHVKKIMPGAFSGCKDLVGVIIPEGITEIPDSCFNACTSLASVTIPSTVTRIGHSAFLNCKSLTSVDLPDGLVELANLAFEECNALTNVKFGTKLKSVGQRAFRRAPIKAVKLPEGLQTIGAQAFDSTKITEVIIPDSTTTVGGHAFAWCFDLTSIHIGANTILGSNIIRYSGVNNISISPSNTKYTVQNDVIYTKDMSTLLFAANGVTNVSIPNGVIRIDYGAFADCGKLTNLYIPASVREVRTLVFSGCTSLTGLTVDPNSTYLKAENNVLFSKDGRVLIGAPDIFTEYTVPASVFRIENSAFQYGKKLKKLIISNGVKEIGDYSFANVNIVNLVVPGSVRVVGTGSFVNNSNLLTATFEEGVQDVWENVFRGCNNLHTVNVPSTVSYIRGGAFAGTNKLTNINIDTNNPNYKVVNNVVYSKDGKRVITTSDVKTQLKLEESTEIIDPFAFINNQFSSVILPTKITTIGERAFENNNRLTSITIPNTCTSIDKNAFDTTPLLTQIIINKPKDSIPGAPWAASQGLKAVIWQ